MQCLLPLRGSDHSWTSGHWLFSSQLPVVLKPHKRERDSNLKLRFVRKCRSLIAKSVLQVHGVEGALTKETENALHGHQGVDRPTRFWLSLSCFGGDQ